MTAAWQHAAPDCAASRTPAHGAQLEPREALPHPPHRGPHQVTRITSSPTSLTSPASPRDRELAEWTRDQFEEYGLDDVEITTHDVLLPWPEEVSVEMTAPQRVARVDAGGSDPRRSAHAGIGRATGTPYHAYSASGDVTAPVIYAGSGNPADYDWLATQGIDVRGNSCSCATRYRTAIAASRR